MSELRLTPMFAGLMGWVALTALASLTAAWALSTKRSWARRAGLLASFANLPLVPIWTPVGIYGLAVLLPRRSAELLSEAAEDRARSKRQRGTPRRFSHQVFAVAVGAVTLPILVLMLRDTDRDPAGWLGVLPGILGGLVITVLAHELGHLAVDRAVGFRLRFISVSRMILLRHPGGWQMLWSRQIAWLSGACSAIPRNVIGLKRNVVAVMAGGPVASLLLALVCFSLFIANQGSDQSGWNPHLAFMAVLSTQVFLLNSIPLADARGTMSDGARIRAVLKGGAEGARILAAYACATSAATPLRPRDWKPDWVRQATALPDGSAFHANGCYDAYMHHLDRGEVEEAGRWLDSAITLQERRPRDLNEGDCLLEGAYLEARHRSRPDVARRRFTEAAGKLSIEGKSRQRVEAAVLLAEGDVAGSLECIRGALASVEKGDQTGLVEFERSLLADLNAEVSARQAAVA